MLKRGNSKCRITQQKNLGRHSQSVEACQASLRQTPMQFGV